ncbi:MAG: hypothetical protein U1E88_06595 [Acinetobacter sp.]
MPMFIHQCQLNWKNAGIELMQGYDHRHLQPHPDLVIVGNAMKRGIDAGLNTC